MNILKRFRNIWRLGEQEYYPVPDDLKQPFIYKSQGRGFSTENIQGTQRTIDIIKRKAKDPIEEIINEQD